MLQWSKRGGCVRGTVGFDLTLCLRVAARGRYFIYKSVIGTQVLCQSLIVVLYIRCYPSMVNVLP